MDDETMLSFCTMICYREGVNAQQVLNYEEETREPYVAPCRSKCMEHNLQIQLTINLSKKAYATCSQCDKEMLMAWYYN